MKHEQGFGAHVARGLTAALALALVVGCGDGGGTVGTTTGGPAPGAAAGDPDAALLQEVEDVEVPSEEEAAQRAEQAIDADNADAEFEKLKQEIDAGG